MLLVEDERLVRITLRHYLERAGLLVLEARTGPEAVERCSSDSQHIDLLITDVVLPGMAGTEVAVRVRQLRPNVAVIYMSGYEPEWLARQGHLLPRTPVLQKPFCSSDLLASIRDVLVERV